MTSKEEEKLDIPEFLKKHPRLSTDQAMQELIRVRDAAVKRSQWLFALDEIISNIWDRPERLPVLRAVREIRKFLMTAELTDD